jgi:hypothetical protein
MRDDRYMEYEEGGYDEQPARQGYSERPVRQGSRQAGDYQPQPRQRSTRQQVEYADDEQAGMDYAEQRRAARAATSRGAGASSRGRVPAAAQGSEGNPVLNGLKAAGGAVAGAVGGLAGNISAARAQAHAVQYDEGDYTGSGAACRMCGYPVDHLQSRCPHCGTFVHPLYKRPTFWVAVVVLVAVIVVLTLAIGSCKANQDGSPVATQTAASTDNLQELVDTAEATLTEQRETHPYTRFTAYNLRQAVTAAESVAADTSATTEARAEAATNLSTAQAAMLQLSGSYDWPVMSDVVANPANYSTSQIAVNVTVVSVGESASSGLTSMVVADPSDSNTQFTVYFYAVDQTAEFGAGSNINLYGEFVYDGTNMALWADKVEPMS